ncbi:hypothetical protein Tco_0757160 [Tanacetum coccineum]
MCPADVSYPSAGPCLSRKGATVCAAFKKVNYFSSLILLGRITSLHVFLHKNTLIAIMCQIFCSEDVHPQLDRFESLYSYCRTPVKVRGLLKEQGLKMKRPIVTVAKHRTVTLLPTSVVRPSGELSASVEREFVGDASVGDEQENEGNREDEEDACHFHPLKGFVRAEYGNTGGSATGGKQRRKQESVLVDQLCSRVSSLEAIEGSLRGKGRGTPLMACTDLQPDVMSIDGSHSSKQDGDYENLIGGCGFRERERLLGASKSEENIDASTRGDLRFTRLKMKRDDMSL